MATRISTSRRRCAPSWRAMSSSRSAYNPPRIEDDDTPAPTVRSRRSHLRAMTDGGPAPLRPWQRLAVRLAVFFALALVLAIGAVGLLVYERQKREVADTVGTQLLNIA